MNIAILIDSFKGTLSSTKLANMIEEHLSNTARHRVVSVPISDGGEGFIDAMETMYPEALRFIETEGPLGESIEANYVLHGRTAYIGLHTAAGLTLMSNVALSPLETSTYGVGVIILDAIDNGAKRIVLGIGGSATNDGGSGLLQALGVRFFTKNEEITSRLNGKLISCIDEIDTSRLKEINRYVDFVIASDVEIPLLGPFGCAHMFSNQKGATDQIRDLLDASMRHYADVVEAHTKKHLRDYPGSGAAGGVGFGALSMLNARIESGIGFFINLFNIEEIVKQSDIVIVGEGRLDHQTDQGKAPYGIAKLAKKHNKTVIGLFGSVKDNMSVDYIDRLYVVVPDYATHEASLLQPKASFMKMLKHVKIP